MTLRTRISFLFACTAFCCAGQVVSQVTITSEPVGLDFTVEGSGCAQTPGPYKSPHVFFWLRTATCRVQWRSSTPPGDGPQFAFDHWHDSSIANPRVFEPVPANVTLTASFVQVAPLIVNVQCRNPSNQQVACTAAPGVVGLTGMWLNMPAFAILGPQDGERSIKAYFKVGGSAAVSLSPRTGVTLLGWIVSGNPPRQIGPVPQVSIPIPAAPVMLTAIVRMP